jgi:ABC-type transport system substrate-binding protein
VNLDQKARVPQVHRIQELALEEAPHVFLAQPYKFTATRKNVKDMYVSFTDFRPGLREIWLEK